MDSIMRRVRGLALAAGVLLLPGCAAAAAGAAGAGAALYLTDRGASTQVQAPLEQAATWATAAMADMGITVDKTETESNEREFHGSNGDRDVKIELKSENGGTQIAVEVKKDPIGWDKDYAKMVLQNIVKRGAA